VFGHEVHGPSSVPRLNTPPHGGSDVVPAPPPAPRGPDRRALGRFRSGKSGFPARAGFWGRRNSHGEIVPLTDPAVRPAALGRWRAVVLPHAAVVLASALLSFGAVMLVMKLRERPPEAVQPRAAAAPVERPATLAPPPPSPPAAAPAPPPAELLPAPAMRPRPARRAARDLPDDSLLEPLDSTFEEQPVARPGGRPRGGPRLDRRRSRADPDGTLAPSFP
jgi:hypothetical protein